LAAAAADPAALAAAADPAALAAAADPAALAAAADPAALAAAAADPAALAAAADPAALAAAADPAALAAAADPAALAAAAADPAALAAAADPAALAAAADPAALAAAADPAALAAAAIDYSAIAGRINHTNSTQSQLSEALDKIATQANGNPEQKIALLKSLTIKAVLTNSTNHYQGMRYRLGNNECYKFSCKYVIEGKDHNNKDIKVELENRTIFTGDTNIDVAIVRAEEYGRVVGEMAKAVQLKGNYTGEFEGLAKAPDAQRDKTMNERKFYIHFEKDNDKLSGLASLKFSDSTLSNINLHTKTPNKSLLYLSQPNKPSFSTSLEELQPQNVVGARIYRNPHEQLRRSAVPVEHAVDADLIQDLKLDDREKMLAYLKSEAKAINDLHAELKDLDKKFQQSGQFTAVGQNIEEFKVFGEAVYKAADKDEPAIKNLDGRLISKELSAYENKLRLYKKLERKKAVLDKRSTDLSALKNGIEQGGVKTLDVTNPFYTEMGLEGLADNLQTPANKQKALTFLNKKLIENEKELKPVADAKVEYLDAKKHLLINQPQPLLEALDQREVIQAKLLQKTASLKKLKAGMDRVKDTYTPTGRFAALRGKPMELIQKQIEATEKMQESNLYRIEHHKALLLGDLTKAANALVSNQNPQGAPVGA
jgi:hypothetical protein